MVRAWTSTQTWIALAVLSAIEASAMIAAAPARACSCVDTSGSLVWPLSGAVDVPVDTPIVVNRRSFSVDPSSIAIRLIDAEGAEVALRETRRLEQLDSECWAKQTVFLRPAEPLAASATYTVIIGEGNGRSFTTGSGTFEPSDYVAPNIRYVHVGPGSDCSDDDGWCSIAEVKLELEAPISDGLWLVLRSRADKDNENRWVYRSDEWASPNPQLSVLLPSDDPCIALTLYGADGTVVFERELCTPDTCVLYGGRGFSTCGEPPNSSLIIDRLPRGGCDAPIIIESGSRGPIYPEPGSSEPDAGPIAPVDAGMPPASDAGDEPRYDTDEDEMKPKTVTACSCDIAGSGRPLSPFGAWLFVAMAWLGGRLSRRWNR